MQKITSYVDTMSFIKAIIELQKLQVVTNAVEEIPRDVKVMAAETECAIRLLWGTIDRLDLQCEMDKKAAEIAAAEAVMEERKPDELVTTDQPDNPPRIPETEEIMNPRDTRNDRG